MSAIFNSRPMPKLSVQAMELLKAHNWPGNVREIENVMERAVLVATQEEITSEQIIIEKSINHLPQDEESKTNHPEAGVTIAEMEKQLIYTTLQHTNQNRTHAARLLGISIRTLRNKLNEYKLEGVSHV